MAEQLEAVGDKAGIQVAGGGEYPFAVGGDGGFAPHVGGIAIVGIDEDVVIVFIVEGMYASFVDLGKSAGVVIGSVLVFGAVVDEGACLFVGQLEEQGVFVGTFYQVGLCQLLCFGGIGRWGGVLIECLFVGGVEVEGDVAQLEGIQGSVGGGSYDVGGGIGIGGQGIVGGGGTGIGGVGAGVAAADAEG